jgi:hypothetical protein
LTLLTTLPNLGLLCFAVLVAAAAMVRIQEVRLVQMALAAVVASINRQAHHLVEWAGLVEVEEVFFPV